ncbi:MAG: DUF692 family protein [Saprospiraceae bacterium]
MATIHATLALNLQQPLLAAAFPLLAAAEVDALEWSFDTWDEKAIPPWFEEVLLAFAQQRRLVGHGVFFSIFSARWTPAQAQWLQQLRRLHERFSFDHISEHFGFMTGADFHKGAPMSVPLTETTLHIGVDRLRRIQDAVTCPVGLENLAFAFSADDVARQGAFMERLLAPINGFLILDLHNLYCQLHNFRADATRLLASYPLHLVREIHISGGSWATPPIQGGTIVRRDTHDSQVPDEVFALLEMAIPLCPNLRYVTLEQMGSSLNSELASATFRTDFQRMKALANLPTNITSSATDTWAAPATPFQADPATDEALFQQQRTLATILETSPDVATAKERLQQSSLAQSAWGIEKWDDTMLHTALDIAQKWA